MTCVETLRLGSFATYVCVYIYFPLEDGVGENESEIFIKGESMEITCLSHADNVVLCGESE